MRALARSVAWRVAFLTLAMLACAAVGATATEYGRGKYTTFGGPTYRPAPASRIDSDAVRQPYPSRYYQDQSRGGTGCRWMMRRAINTQNRNWLMRYFACTQ